MKNMIETMGVTWPTYGDWVAGGVALVILVLAWLIAWYSGRRLGARLAGLWAKHAGARGEAIAPKMCDLVRYAVAALLLAIVLNVDLWRPLGAIVLGLGVATSVALLVWTLVTALRMPRWIAGVLAASAFVALIARVFGGLHEIEALLERVGFTVSKHRYSLLTAIQIVVTLVALYAVVKLLNRIAAQTIRRAQSLDATQQLLAQKLAAVAILVIAFFVGIDLLGIDLTALAVFSGAFGLAIGFGLQKTFGNLIAGIILLMDRSIKPGDVIAVGDSFGHVNKIGVRAVSIITRDGKEHLIPNENLMTQEVENWSYSSRDVRVHIKVGIAYDCDLPLAQKLMIEAATQAKRVLAQPKPSIWLIGFGESSVDHEVLVWISDPEGGIGSVRSEILNRLWVLFKENGIAIPNPQRDIHIRDWPGTPAVSDPPRDGEGDQPKAGGGGPEDGA
jgi:small-conductance mechanosensitive channel